MSSGVVPRTVNSYITSEVVHKPINELPSQLHADRSSSGYVYTQENAQTYVQSHNDIKNDHIVSNNISNSTNPYIHTFQNIP